MRIELEKLLVGGFVGQFDHIELIEVIGTPPKSPSINVLSIAVLGEGRRLDDDERPQFLTGRIAIEGFPGWSFGVVRMLRPVTALDAALDHLARTGEWTLSGKKLGTGELQAEPQAFAAPDGSFTIPLNRVLKNNFWAGSHVFRLHDGLKTPHAPFFLDRRRLQTLSDAVEAAVPIPFAGLSDLLGDVLIQVPVLGLVAEFQPGARASNSTATVEWRPGIPSRSLAAAARTRWDGLLTGAAIVGNFDSSTIMPIDAHRQPLEGEIWDASTGTLLAASAPTSTLKSAQIAIRMVEPEPRIFDSIGAEGQSVPARVTLVTTMHSTVGDTAGTEANTWLGKRQDLEERRRLEETRDFAQYRPRPGCAAERERGLTDLRFLIDKHGEKGVDLWDPYLTASDLLQTLFWCQHAGAPLRALTDGRDPPRPKDPLIGPPAPTPPPFRERQKSTLIQNGGNHQGLRLTYKTRFGPKGWAFHDRFLIFPNQESGPLAWSLGTSINSFGNAHHILQRVSSPALVAGAFEDLWSALDETNHVIWECG
ncbi:hypothetical protein CFR74_12420 [Novacetimonas hansenii]|nr:hypothetical protein CFR74_12420 [Novacetimonas hansenii]